LINFWFDDLFFFFFRWSKVQVWEYHDDEMFLLQVQRQGEACEVFCYWEPSSFAAGAGLLEPVRCPATGTMTRRSLRGVVLLGAVLFRCWSWAA
jgi:hypothetical protein